VAAPRPWIPTEGGALIGTRAPEWKGIEWIQGEPTTLADLRGKVVLVRFWLMDCAYCTRTAPALRELSKRYEDRGLVVVGLHHPKSDPARDPKAVARAARALGLDFRVGLDNDWETIRAYGVGRVFQRFTSVTFLIDRQGIIRFVHDGGEFHEGEGHAECNAAYRALEAAIVEALR
jgi:peroxiredoxin